MSLVPRFADRQARLVLVVGGGAVAERKIKSLRASGADVRVGALQASDALQELHRQGKIELLQGPFDSVWLEGAWLVVAATDDRELNRHVAALAGTQKRFINVVDDPEIGRAHV